MKTKMLTWILFLLVLVYSASAAIKSMQDESEITVYSAEGASYTITAAYINDGKVIFDVNGETSGKLAYHETCKFEDGSIIFVREILEEEVMEGPDKVIFNFYPAECGECDFHLADSEVKGDEEEPAKESSETEEPEEKTTGEAEKKIILSEQSEETPEEKGWLKRFIDWFINWFIWWRD